MKIWQILLALKLKCMNSKYSTTLNGLFLSNNYNNTMKTTDTQTIMKNILP